MSSFQRESKGISVVCREKQEGSMSSFQRESRGVSLVWRKKQKGSMSSSQRERAGGLRLGLRVRV